MKFEKIKEGMTLYDVHTYKMGNTSMRSVGVWPVLVVSLDETYKSAKVVWNGNTHRQQTYYQRQREKLREVGPVLVKDGMRYRLQTREEKKAEKARGTP